MKQADKKQYEAPQMTVATFKVEQGFAASGAMSNYNNHGSENWIEGLIEGGSGISDYSNNETEDWI